MAGKNTGSAMGVGGGGGIFSRKTELVADLTSAFKTLNQELEKTKKLSDDIAKNLKGAKPGGSGSSNLLAGSLGSSTGTQDTAQNGGGGLTLGAVAQTGLKLGGLGLQSLPTVQQAFEQNMNANRFRFYSGGSLASANAFQMDLAKKGTVTDPMDAARASMTGASMGLMPGLMNQASIKNSIAGISNLMPGVGATGGVQAMAALNQGKNVNMLKMIGINVRGADGMMRGFDDIAKDLWATLNKGKTGAGKITKADLDMSLQPGNALDSMMNQYFGNDPILRQSVITKLYETAGNGGKVASSLDKKGQAKSGVSTTSAQSASDRNAASLNAIQAVAPSTLAGFEKANDMLAAASNKLADIARDSGIIGDALRAALYGKGFGDTLGSAGNGAGAGLMSMVGGGVGGFLGNLFGKGGMSGATGGGAGGFKGMFGKFGKFMPKSMMGFLGRGALAAGTYAGMDKLQAWLNKADVPDWVRKAGNVAFDTGQGALTGLMAGGLPGAIAGTGIGAATSLMDPYGQGGGDEQGVNPGKMYPLSGSPIITSQFGSIRDLTFPDGSKSRTNGKPHGGVDYGVPIGTPVFAASDGTVEDTAYDNGGYGNYIRMRDKDGNQLYYGHLDSKAASGGQKVKAGDLIGYSGNSGGSTGAHLHFEVRNAGNKIDPLAYISGAGTPSLLDGAGTSGQIVRQNLRLENSAAAALTLGQGGEGMVGAPEYARGNRSSHDGDTVVNYGGVTVKFYMPEKGSNDVNAIAQEVKRVLSADSIREKAVGN